jgi:hypothetical protein
VKVLSWTPVAPDETTCDSESSTIKGGKNILLAKIAKGKCLKKYQYESHMFTAGLKQDLKTWRPLRSWHPLREKKGLKFYGIRSYRPGVGKSDEVRTMREGNGL